MYTNIVFIFVRYKKIVAFVCNRHFPYFERVLRDFSWFELSIFIIRNDLLRVANFSLTKTIANINVFKPDPDTEPNDLPDCWITGSTADEPQVNK